MTYYNAQNSFGENKQLVGPDPMADPQNWNLNNGLQNFAAAVEQDLNELKQMIVKLQRQIASMQR